MCGHMCMCSVNMRMCVRVYVCTGMYVYKYMCVGTYVSVCMRMCVWAHEMSAMIYELRIGCLGNGCI